jgi:hypothetical protein
VARNIIRLFPNYKEKAAPTRDRMVPLPNVRYFAIDHLERLMITGRLVVLAGAKRLSAR